MSAAENPHGVKVEVQWHPMFGWQVWLSWDGGNDFKDDFLTKRGAIRWARRRVQRLRPLPEKEDVTAEVLR